MSEYLIQESTLTDIADAIRFQSGETEEITVNNMATKIREIKGLVDYENTAATEISDYCFYKFRNLRTVSFPEATTIGRNAFAQGTPNNSSILTTANFPLVTDVGVNAFEYCSNLSSINLDSATEIGGLAFYNCRNLTNISLPVCTRIGESSFADCTSLVSVDAPNVETIHTFAFRNCVNLTDINMPKLKDNPGYGSAFQGCSGLEHISLPSLKNVYEYMFKGCSSLKTVNLPQVERVLDYGFDNCTNLSKITLPNLYDSIDGYPFGDNAFKRCSNLIAIILPNVTQAPLFLYTSTFTDTPIANGTGYIYVPDSLVDSFKTAEGWSTYASQIKPLSEYVEE